MINASTVRAIFLFALMEFDNDILTSNKTIMLLVHIGY